jgi:hypothetical protein
MRKEQLLIGMCVGILAAALSPQAAKADVNQFGARLLVRVHMNATPPANDDLFIMTTPPSSSPDSSGLCSRVGGNPLLPRCAAGDTYKQDLAFPEGTQSVVWQLVLGDASGSTRTIATGKARVGTPSAPTLLTLTYGIVGAPGTGAISGAASITALLLLSSGSIAIVFSLCKRRRPMRQSVSD